MTAVLDWEFGSGDFLFDVAYVLFQNENEFYYAEKDFRHAYKKADLNLEKYEERMRCCKLIYCIRLFDFHISRNDEDDIDELLNKIPI